MAAEDWKSDLNSLFNPRSIAIVGASEAKGSFTNVAYEYLIRFGYKGRIYPVNPRREKVWELPSFKTLKDIDGSVDEVIIGVAARMVPPILTECGEKGIGSAIIFSSGFAEVGNKEGIGLQKELAAIAETFKIRVCGPNCVGFAAIKSNVVCYSAPLPPVIPRGRVAYISQSATMAANVVSAGANNGIGFAYLVSSGNEAVLEFSDYLRYMLHDPEIDIVAAFVEGIKDAPKFFEVTDLAARLEKPLLILKIGKSQKGTQAAASHTGALTGSYAVCQAAFKQKGVISVESIEQMVESIKLFSFRKPIKTGGLSIIAGSGGVCGFLSDRSEEVGLPIPDFSPTTEARLKEVLPSFGTVHNPLDTTGQARTEPDMITKVTRAILMDDQIDIIVHGLASTRSILSPFIRPLLDKFAELGHEYPHKLLALLSCNTESFADEINQFSTTYQVPVLQGGGVGLRALKHLLDFNWFLTHQKERKQEAMPTTPANVVERWSSLLGQRKDPLSEGVAKALLKDYGIRVPRGSVVFTLEEAKIAASKIGYPVVLKIHSSKITHKTETGGIKLNLQDETAVIRAFSELEPLTKKAGSDEGFLLEEMIGSGVEFILGMQSDPTFGPVIMLGLGGIFAEVFKDITFRLPPFDSQEARAMVQEVRGSKLLSGFRGKPKCDVDALLDALSRLGRLAQDLSEVVSEIDINPLAILEQGKGVVALDALVIPALSR